MPTAQEPHSDGAPYLAFTADTEQQQAKDRFIEKYGEEPQYVFESNGLLLVGPINE